jgi:hypothetical protein
MEQWSKVKLRQTASGQPQLLPDQTGAEPHSSEKSLQASVATERFNSWKWNQDRDSQ